MLSHFSVKNFRNFNDWTHFDLTSDKKYTFNENAVTQGIIKHSMLYGENGQGKTNLGIAMCELTTHLNPDSRNNLITQDDNTNADNDSDISEFCYQFNFAQQQVKYHYGKDKSQTLVFEVLSINDEVILNWNRTENTSAIINLAGAGTLDKNLSQNIKSIVLYVKSNAKLLATPSSKAFLDFIEFTQKMIYFRSINNVDYYLGKQQQGNVLNYIINANKVDKFQQFLNEFGVNCKLGIYQNLDGNDLVFEHKNRKLGFAKTASSGTKELAILFYWLEYINDGTVSFAFIDEFDAFYHHNLAKQIARLTANLAAQTILSTHNTSIMTNDILRPDCYFAIKNCQIAPLHDLTDRELRKAHSLEKLYRSGAFDEQ